MRRSPMSLTANERGIALILTLFLSIIIASMAIGIIMMTSNANLISRFHAKEAEMEASADAGLEVARDSMNGSGLILPPTGFDTLELAAIVRDASGNVIPGYTRSTYAGRSGILTGQFGVFASVISVISDPRGSVVVRRVQLSQESFAKFAEFTDTFPAGLCVGYGNVKFGPVHANQSYPLCGVGPAIFNGLLTTAGVIINQGVGTYNAGFKTNVPRINMPTPIALASVQTIAAGASMSMVGGAINLNDPDIRIEFVPLDLNADGNTTDADEGFIRVFRVSAGGTQAIKRQYVNARRWYTNAAVAAGLAAQGVTTTSDPNMESPNCGGTLKMGALLVSTWLRADSIIQIFGATKAGRDSVRAALGSPARHCYLGGDPALTNGIFTPNAPTSPLNQYGSWAPWAFAPDPRVVAATAAIGQPAMANYLWPISRNLNPNFQGVIYVTGSVALSGQVRGQVLVAATGFEMLDDDLTYVTAPNTTCADVLGYTTPVGVRMADNNANTPFKVNNNYLAGFNNTPSEIFHGSFLSLVTFDGENICGGCGPGAGTPVAGREDCGVVQQGRGCDIVIGGLIQKTAGATAMGGSNEGWNDQYSYDNCSLRNPPPYFPTTGRYAKYQYFEIDPVGFNVATWFANNQ